MAAVHNFNYLKPSSLDEALAALAQYGDNARVLAGGTDIALQLKEGTIAPDIVIDIKGLKELSALTHDDDGLHIGAVVSFSQIVQSEIVREHFPLLAAAAGTVGSVGIRNRATLGGNVCSAVPSLDSGPTLLVYEAVAHLKSAERERDVPLAEWFVGPKQPALRSDELLTGVTLPNPEKNAAGCYVKLGRYAGEDLAQAGVGVLALDGHEYRIAFCAVGPIPKRATSIEALLQGKELSDALLDEAKTLVPEMISPITDIRASKEYRLLMVKVMLERGLKTAMSRLNGETTTFRALWV